MDEEGKLIERSFPETLSAYIEHKKFYRFEGDSGLKNLEVFLKDLGYPDHQWKFGSPIESFLSDNSGACQALIEWIELQNIPEWKENLEACLPEKENEEQEE